MIPYVFGMCPATIKFLLFSGWFVGSSDVSQKFRRSGVPAMVGTSDPWNFQLKHVGTFDEPNPRNKVTAVTRPIPDTDMSGVLGHRTPSILPWLGKY